MTGVCFRKIVALPMCETTLFRRDGLSLLISLQSLHTRLRLLRAQCRTVALIMFDGAFICLIPCHILSCLVLLSVTVMSCHFPSYPVLPVSFSYDLS